MLFHPLVVLKCGLLVLLDWNIQVSSFFPGRSAWKSLARRFGTSGDKTQRVVGFSTSPRMTEELAMDAFQKAWGMTHPGKGLIVHTDQGSQFTGRRFRSLLKGNDAICSNSRKGNPCDNAMMESFYRTLKRELVSGRKFESREEAKKEVFKFIELYYNSVRMHSALGYASPCFHRFPKEY